MFLFIEKRVSVPSNVGDLVNIGYLEGKIELKFVDLLKSLWELEILNDGEVLRIAENCIRQLNDKVVLKKSKISQSEVNEVIMFVNDHFRPKVLETRT